MKCVYPLNAGNTIWTSVLVFRKKIIWNFLILSEWSRKALMVVGVCGKWALSACMANEHSGHHTTTTTTTNCIQRRNLRFFTISSLHRKLSPTRTLKWPRHNRVKITCNTLSAYHVQRVVCHLVRRDSSAIKFDTAEIAFILVLLYWLKPFTEEGKWAQWACMVNEHSGHAW